jgi:hypothetical protein
MDSLNQHCENGHTTKINLHVQCNLYQNLIDILHRDRKIYPEIQMETQKTLNSKRNSEQKIQCLRYHNSQLQIILHSGNNINSTALAKNRQKEQWIRVKAPDINYKATDN